VPYRGGRYTIPSMYRFLCYKYYLGGSFPGWFWHYAWWGLFLTLLIMGVIIIVFFGPERDPTEDRYVRGANVTSTRRLGRALSGDGIEVGGIRIPRMLESQHFLFVGAPGSASPPPSGSCCGRSPRAEKQLWSWTRSASTCRSSTAPVAAT
jgi:hypothetical protein